MNEIRSAAQRRPRISRASLVAIAILALVAVFFPIAPPKAEANNSPTLAIDGRGWGHGRGMSQYGAFGYARDHGWSTGQILNHYYGGTSAKQQYTNTGPWLDVRLMAMDQQTTIRVTVPSSGSFLVTSSNAPIQPPSDHKALELRRSGSQWAVWSRPSLSSGSWAQQGTAPRIATIENPGSGPITVRGPGGDRAYPGAVRGYINGSSVRTIAVIRTETYLRGVVPNEMPSSWHAAALRAQAIAARSYVLAGDGRHHVGGEKYADTCDSTLCQVYNPSRTAARTDTAISDTRGQIRVHSNGNIARTEYSSTSGGHTAGGTFPAVPDAGDSISPVHTWSTKVSARPLETTYGGGSQLTSIAVTKRNGLGAMGGRALEVRLRFANGTQRTVTGDQVRSTLGLRSNWFSVQIDNDPVAAYINAAYQLFLSRAPEPSAIEHWRPFIERGDRATMTQALSVSEEWAGVEIRNLYRKILGRSPDSSGFNYWMGHIRNGMMIERMATEFYGSPEYFQRSGSTNHGFIDRLYRDLLGRPADQSGLNYWVDQLNRGLARSSAAHWFYMSVESRRDRVQRLYQLILNRNPDAAGWNYWAGALPNLGDIALARELAASQEFYVISTR